MINTPHGKDQGAMILAKETWSVLVARLTGSEVGGALE